MKKYRFIINNLDCANCARRVEEALNKEKDLVNVIVNFSTSKLSFESDKTISLNEINNLVKNIEPDAMVIDNSNTINKEYPLIILIIPIILITLSFVIPNKLIKDILIILSYIILLKRPFLNALKSLIKSKSINENLLITISCVGAYLIGEVMEGLMVVLLYIIGKILEEKALNHTRSSIKDLMDLKQDYANKKIDSEIKKIAVSDIKIDDVLIIKKGEKVPVDGIITKGKGIFDTSMLTGESDLVEINTNQEILSGYINVGEVFEMKATRVFENSTIARILELVENATDKKADLETTVTKFSKVYTPTVLILAVLTIIILIMFTNIGFKESLYRGLTFLVISCPCAIAISVPLAYFTGIGVSSKNGILIKGSNYLDNLSNINKIIFDKTGTLTTGSFEVKEIEIIDKTYRKNDLIELLQKGESLSNHPIAKSIMKLSNKKINNSDVSNFRELSGKGIKYQINEDRIRVGNQKICKNCSINTDLHININGCHIASFAINDGIKENARKTIEKLNNYQIDTYMFTGDKKEVASEIGSRLGIKYIKAEMLPDEKYLSYEKIKNNNDIVAFVGDGINDAPVLKRADIGISMGGVGSFQAIESSDIVLMKDDLSKIITGLNISKYTKYIIKQNLCFAILVKVSILILSILGLASMWLAVFADTGVTVLAILNTLRIMKKKY